eukprot:3181733-Amphidinium_carterae.1
MSWRGPCPEAVQVVSREHVDVDAAMHQLLRTIPEIFAEKLCSEVLKSIAQNKATHTVQTKMIA